MIFGQIGETSVKSDAYFCKIFETAAVFIYLSVWYNRKWSQTAGRGAVYNNLIAREEIICHFL